METSNVKTIMIIILMWIGTIIITFQAAFNYGWNSGKEWVIKHKEWYTNDKLK